jgi:hypothetical protein
MNEIVCECGHGIGEHAHIGCKHMKRDMAGKYKCECGASPNLVEARYWARKMMAERDALQKDLDRIANPTVEILRDEFSLSQPPGGVLGFFMKGFTQMFIDQGAKNYIEVLLRNAANSDDPTEYIFHIQKRAGKTPHELRQEAEKERDALQAKLDEAREALRYAAIYVNGNRIKDALARLDENKSTGG